MVARILMMRRCPRRRAFILRLGESAEVSAARSLRLLGIAMRVLFSARGEMPRARSVARSTFDASELGSPRTRTRRCSMLIIFTPACTRRAATARVAHLPTRHTLKYATFQVIYMATYALWCSRRRFTKLLLRGPHVKMRDADAI